MSHFYIEGDKNKGDSFRGSGFRGIGNMWMSEAKSQIRCYQLLDALFQSLI